MPAGRAPEVVVTGIGLVTPAGIGRERTWERVCSGRPTATDDPELEGLSVGFSCRMPGFDPAALLPGVQHWRVDRYTFLALAAAREAVADAGLVPESWDGDRVAVVVGSAAGGVATLAEQQDRLRERGPGLVSPLTLPMFLPNMAAGHIATDLRARGPNLHTGTACASGATAIGIAVDLLRADACDVALAGGADAMVTRLCAAAFARMGALSRRAEDPAAASRPFDTDRDGFVLAEGAGVLVLERAPDAVARRVRRYATLAGHGASADAHHQTAPHPQGVGAELALRRALLDADASPADVDHVNAHGTSTPMNDRVEGAVIERLLTGRPSVTATKGVTGHTMGAAGAIEAALTALTVFHATTPPTANLQRPLSEAELDLVSGTARTGKVALALSNSFGFGGHNEVLAFRSA
ncbi:beta-ketoacyl-[acyl-carrier-protein] synthase family protein [Streptomyces sp. NBC_01239]|uniref:beta-ketoacyl-[acyl-carrier-protein] synthase family protein n=1 Tax=Streptomyces sp. NBC_01239 TaxID=2903792 RepID=UPI002251494C|nr:beta-ketoacyl-[acyl-carrier-protein] synthase family protein [Streptomyces sp. NBC_01239]MCX4817607.1 beta-ketoacyl-[acyl-carrier-protein] synthase family protein [Streptomyces sp. NBC_01239]